MLKIITSRSNTRLRDFLNYPQHGALFYSSDGLYGIREKESQIYFKTISYLWAFNSNHAIDFGGGGYQQFNFFSYCRGRWLVCQIIMYCGNKGGINERKNKMIQNQTVKLGWPGFQKKN